MKQIDPTALFRLSVLGPLVSRERLERGELQRTLRELAQRQYAIPNSRRTYLGEKTIESWLYKYRREGIDGLAPKTRIDRGRSKIAPALQEAIVAASATIHAGRSARYGNCCKRAARRPRTTCRARRSTACWPVTA